MSDENKKIEQLERRLREAEALADRLVRAETREAHIKQVLLAIRKVNKLLTSEDNPLRLIERACENLTETLGYQNAWIALLGEGQKVIQSAFSGFGDTARHLRDQLQQGQIPSCMRRALQENAIVVLDDPQSMCPECPVSKSYNNRAVVSSPLIFGE